MTGPLAHVNYCVSRIETRHDLPRRVKLDHPSDVCREMRKATVFQLEKSGRRDKGIDLSLTETDDSGSGLGENPKRLESFTCLYSTHNFSDRTVALTNRTFSGEKITR